VKIHRDAGRQADRQSDGYSGWCLELKRGGRQEEENEGFVEDQRFQFEVQEL